MPIRSGAMQRPCGCRCGNTLRQRYDEVGLPCSSTMGSPSPTSTYAISLPRTRRRCFWYGNAAEITGRLILDFWPVGIRLLDVARNVLFPFPLNVLVQIQIERPVNDFPRFR